MTPSSAPTSSTSPIIYLDLALGDESSYITALEEYKTVVDWYEKNRQVYGFDEETGVDELDDVGGELLKGCFEAENPGKPCPLHPPKPLNTGQIKFRLFDTPNLQKQTLNYLHLLTSTSTLQTNKKKLGYKGCTVHRYEPGFVLQGGDVTRGDGSGGESIYGGSLPDPKPPHRPHAYGSLSYASGSAKNSSTSQFFICLASSAEMRKKKLDGKYFPFGEVMEEDVDKLKAFEEVLERDEGGWDDVRKGGGRCWIADCGVC